MAKFKFKHQMYQHLQHNAASVYADARNAAEDLKIPKELRGMFGLTGGISGCPGPLREDMVAAGEEAALKVRPLASMVDQIREMVKDIYGDGYDAAPTSTCEAALWTCFDTLFTPAFSGRGDSYRARYLAPLERHFHHQGAYGRPYPGRYKDLIADRAVTAGELGTAGKRLTNLDTVVVPLAGARYDVHGIKSHPCPLLTHVDVEQVYEDVKKHAAIHATMFSGITSLGYDTVGYGYEKKDTDGSPKLQKMYARVAGEYGVPYVVDNAWGLPGVGHDIRKSGADVVVYSMDKTAGCGTSGLIIGKENVMVAIRRALGYHGERWGTGSSYGKAAYVAFDPGKQALATQIQALKVLRHDPGIYTNAVDDLYDVVVDEFKKIHPKLKAGIVINKTYNSRAVEVNYEGTWANGEMGLPIFSMEDMYSGTNLMQSGLEQMGVIPTIAYDGNIYISPDLMTTDNKGNLLTEVMRYAVRAQVVLMEIIAKHAGVV